MHRTIVNVLRISANRNMQLYRIIQNTVKSDSRKSAFCTNHSVAQREPVQIMCRRFKHTKRKRHQEGESTDTDDDDDDDDDEIELPYDTRNTKIISKRVNALRLDCILKDGLGIGRNKVDEAFYNSNIRLNEQRVAKKSTFVNIGDKIDLVNNRDADNSKLLRVARVTILKAKFLDDCIKVTLARDKSLLIQDYKDSWTGTPL